MKKSITADIISQVTPKPTVCNGHLKILQNKQWDRKSGKHIPENPFTDKENVQRTSRPLCQIQQESATSRAILCLKDFARKWHD